MGRGSGWEMFFTPSPQRGLEGGLEGGQLDQNGAKMTSGAAEIVFVQELLHIPLVKVLEMFGET